MINNGHEGISDEEMLVLLSKPEGISLDIAPPLDRIKNLLKMEIISPIQRSCLNLWIAQGGVIK